MKNDLTVKSAFAELETITKEFEQQEIDLDTAIPKYKRAVELAKYIKKQLADITNTLEEISLDLEEEKS